MNTRGSWWGGLFSANVLERMFRDLYADNTTEAAIRKRILEDVAVEHFRHKTAA